MRWMLLAAVLLVMVGLGYYGLEDMRRYLRLRDMQPMCLGIPGRVVDCPVGADLGRVEVAGVVRDINLSLLDGPLTPGEYVLIHSGFAIERMSVQRAADALAFFGAEL